MFAAALTKYVFLTLTTLHLLDIAVAYSPNFESYRELLDYLYTNGYIKSLTIKKAMGFVDRKFFVTGKPYEDSSQETVYGVRILAPHVEALVLGALESRLPIGAHVACILCHSGYLPSIMAIYVLNRGIVLGIEKDSSVTNFDYENIEKWIASSHIAKAYHFNRHSPFQFYTRSDPGEKVGPDSYSATFYNGDDKNTIDKLKQRLRKMGRLVYLTRTERGGQVLMVIDRLSNGSFHERMLAHVRSDKVKEEEGERGREDLGGERGEEDLGRERGEEVEGPLKEIEEAVTPTPVPPPFVDFDDVLLSSVQIKHIPDVKIILLLVCIAIISWIQLF
ncbi:unnamed protein product [Trichobilharzia szidati]|nr:unnamed protein product [Trichobilharzia szidati]